MARVGRSAAAKDDGVEAVENFTAADVQTRPASEEADGAATPVPESEGSKDGVHDGKPRAVVGEYEERPYSKAVMPEHLEVLRLAGQEPGKTE